MTDTCAPAAATQRQALADALQALRTGQGSVQALADAAGHAQALRAALPVRFGTVLDDLLDRLATSALFGEESCSFSQKDLLDGLQDWLAHAQARLRQGPAAR